MIRGKKVTAIIPVRGGSKGVPRKNLYVFQNLTLLERAILFAKDSKYIDEIYVSTDDLEMYEISRKYNVSTPTLRPKHLAKDESKTIDTIEHLINTLPIMDGYILILQVTSPLRTQNDLDEICNLIENEDNIDAIISGVKINEPHPYKMFTINNNFLKPLIVNEFSTPRQMLPEVWAFNGAFYLISLDSIIKEKTLIPSRSKIYPMPHDRSINIDSINDILLLEAKEKISNIKEN